MLRPCFFKLDQTIEKLEGKEKAYSKVLYYSFVSSDLVEVLHESSCPGVVIRAFKYAVPLQNEITEML